MKDAAEPDSTSATSLHPALLEYFSAPGKYQLSLRQPAILFASIREVLQIAAGRGAVEGLPRPEAARLSEAAAFFVRAALLYPGADHYAVLGYARGTEPAEVKERYRLLMRLTHPDFAPPGASAWPADAAVRVNRAYEVLSSPVLRKQYDEQLGTLQAQRAAEAPNPKARPVPARARQEARGWTVNPRAAWALAAGFLMLGVLMLWPAPEPVDLVQRLPAPGAARAGNGEPLRIDPEPTTPAALRPSELASAVRPAQPAPLPPAPAAPPPLRAEPALALQAPPAPVPSAKREAVIPPAPSTAVASPPAQAAAATLPPSAPPPAPSTPAPRGQAAGAQPQAARAPVPVDPPRAQEAAPRVAAAPDMRTPATPIASAPARPTTAPTPLPSPTLADAQPLLSQLLELLESGSGKQLLRLLETDARHSPSAQALSAHYDGLIRGARPVRLSHVEFKGEPREGGVLLVTGRLRLHAGEPTIGSHGERFLVRAEFVSRGGKVMLTGLSGASD